MSCEFFCRLQISLIMPNWFFVASVSCLQVCNCNKSIKKIWQGTYLLSRATYFGKCCWRVAKIINLSYNFFPCLPKEKMERKPGEWARDTSLDFLSICLTRSFVLTRFEFYLGWQKFWYKGHVYTVCICFPGPQVPHPCHMAISHCC